MLWLRMVIIWTAVIAGDAINRPVYKVVLNQKGFAQFLKYDLETPPLIEFTFCTWLRLYNLAREQTIFTYIVNSNRNMVRLWIDSGGRNVQLTINGWLATTSPIEMVKDVWKHVCVSYQSDFGAWALYVDARLVTCGAAQALHGFILPPGGSVNIGYGTTDNGAPSGIDGEIFGSNMILISTIERNFTMKQNPRFQQKSFQKNKVKDNRGEIDKYIILDDFKVNKIQNTFENGPNSFTGSPNMSTTMGDAQYAPMETSNERDILDFSIPGRMSTTTSDPNGVQFWHLVSDAVREGRSEKSREPSSSDTRDLPSVSEFETPPPPVTVNLDFINKRLEEKAEQSISIKPTTKNNEKDDKPSEIETPPPPQNDNKVYGQWVSSKFAASVLNHLRSMRLNKKDINKSPPTIPLYKSSDAYPYASEFKLTKLRPPAEFERRSLVESQIYSETLGKRRPQFNVQILEDDIRERILKSHSRIKPMNINVINKGESKLSHERFYREAVYASQSSGSSESIEIENTPRPFSKSTKMQNNSYLFPDTQSQTINKKEKLLSFFTVLPFLKTLEYFVEDSEKTESKNDVYTRSLSGGNKWHNSKSYSNDYTPRQINIDTNVPSNDMESKLADANDRHPAVKLKYKHRSRKEKVEPLIVDGRNLAKTVSSHAEIDLGKSQNINSVSIQKFMYDSETEDPKNYQKDNYNENSSLEDALKTNNFNKHIKIGNALNERHVIGRDEVQRKRSFVGGDARVPDINRYRSDIDKEDGKVPSSLSPKVCKNVELYDRVLYIQPDESVDLTYFLSPVKLKNPAIEFIQQNYKLCSLEGSVFQKDPLLYLDWSKTPVRLFGGAYLQTTTDLCGFF